MSESAQRYVEELLGQDPNSTSHTVRISDISQVEAALEAKGWHVVHLRDDLYKLTRSKPDRNPD
jgi:hypothetical protein